MSTAFLVIHVSRTFGLPRETLDEKLDKVDPRKTKPADGLTPPEVLYYRWVNRRKDLPRLKYSITGG